MGKLLRLRYAKSWRLTTFIKVRNRRAFGKQKFEYVLVLDVPQKDRHNTSGQMLCFAIKAHCKLEVLVTKTCHIV